MDLWTGLRLGLHNCYYFWSDKIHTERLIVRFSSYSSSKSWESERDESILCIICLWENCGIELPSTEKRHYYPQILVFYVVLSDPLPFYWQSELFNIYKGGVTLNWHLKEWTNKLFSFHFSPFNNLFQIALIKSSLRFVLLHIGFWHLFIFPTLFLFSRYWH